MQRRKKKSPRGHRRRAAAAVSVVRNTTGAVQQQLGRRARKVLDPISPPPPSRERAYLSRRVAVVVVVVADLRVQGHRPHIVRANSTHTNTQYCVFFFYFFASQAVSFSSPTETDRSTAIILLQCGAWAVLFGVTSSSSSSDVLCEAEAYRYTRFSFSTVAATSLFQWSNDLLYYTRTHNI